MPVEHSISLFFKVVGPAEGTEQWKLFNLSKLQSLYSKVLFSLKFDPFVCTKFHSGPKEVMTINQHLKVFTAYTEAPSPHKHTSQIHSVDIL